MTEAELRERLPGKLEELGAAVLEELGDVGELMRLWPRVWRYIRRGLAEEAASGGGASPGPF